MKWRRLTALLCCPFLLFTPSICSAADADPSAAILPSDSGYQAYLRQHDDEAALPDLLLEPGCSDASGDLRETDGRTAIASPAGSLTKWSFTVVVPGYYHLEINYHAGKGSGGALERNLFLDGAVPFNEARGLLLKRQFSCSDERIVNVLGNEVKPKMTEIVSWQKNTVFSASGYISEALQFYLSAGSHTLTLEAVRESGYYGDLRFYRMSEPLSYHEYIAQYEENGGVQGLEPLFVEAHKPAAVSDLTLYPASDRSSPYTKPSSTGKAVINVIGGDSWKTSGQAISYALDVKRDGLYTIAVRYKQDTLPGMCVYRRLTVDERLPFKEAENIKFKYDNAWQLEKLGDGNEAYLFFLSEGSHTLTFEVTCGEFSGTLSELNESLAVLNAIYREILTVTGRDPDLYRDYNFTALIPDTLSKIRAESERLQKINKRITELSEKKSSQAIAIDNLIRQLGQMAVKPERYIAQGLTSFKSNIAALGTWISGAVSQPLMMNYMLIDRPDSALPKGDAGFFGILVYEFRKFLTSFTNDYNVASILSSENMETVNAWIYTGRDQAQIVRNLIDNSFIPEEQTMVNLKLVTPGTLIPATLAGKGPDVSMGSASAEAMNLAVRSAAADLRKLEGFDLIKARFYDSALVPFTFNDAVYALPETQSFLMMFYRTDILENMGLKAPVTWEELQSMMLELQTENMEVGLPVSYLGYCMYLFQNGGGLYSDDAAKSLLGTDQGLSAFKQWTDYFVLHDFPVQYDFANRFRNGEMPIGIQDYTMYNQLLLFAPEIKGLWSMVPIPGIRRENGTINNASPAMATGAVILKNSQRIEAAWRFLRWWTSGAVQSDFGVQMESVIGEAAKYATANREAMASLSWSYRDFAELNRQWETVAGIPEVPGGYYTQRYVEFAFNKVVTGSVNAVETLEGYVPIVDAELGRKLKEFRNSP